jgi:hypothetical protein
MTEIDKNQSIWNNMTTIKELQTTTIEFIKGNLTQTPNHYGPLEMDSQKLKTQLIKLNELGFITTGGQGSLDEKGFCEKTWIDYYGNKCGNHFYREQQKPNVSGFMKVSIILDVMEKIKTTKPFIKYIFILPNDKIRNCEYMWITRHKVYAQQSDENIAEWKNYTHEWDCPNLEEAITNAFTNKIINNILRKNYCHFEFFIDEYGSSIVLEDHLIEIIENIFVDHKL